MAPLGRARLRQGLGARLGRGRIVEIDILADPERLRELDLSFLDG